MCLTQKYEEPFIDEVMLLQSRNWGQGRWHTRATLSKLRKQTD